MMKTGLIILFMSLLTFGITAMELPTLDKSKYTLCSITINSDEEIKTFKKHITPKEFNPVIELTDFANDLLSENGGADWFDLACKSGVKCDALVVSGHFAGTFFGSSGKTLSIETLESHGCNRSCEGILQNPKEVYLFGCNTLATKVKDHRSPEEYYAVLIADGISPEEARRVVESRYGAVGDTFRGRMQRVFHGRKQIYGFDSVGPSGKNIEKFLHDSFKKNKNYADRLTETTLRLALNELDYVNKEMEQALKQTAHTQCSVKSMQDESMERICTLLREGVPLKIKEEMADDMLNSSDYSLYLPVVNNFLKANPEAILSERTRANVNLKKGLLALLLKSEGLAPFLEYGEIVQRLDFISPREFQKNRDAKIISLFKKPLSIESKDILCGQEIHLSLDVKNIHPANFISAHGLEALSCVDELNLPIQNKIGELLKKTKKHQDQQSILSYFKVVSQISPDLISLFLPYVKSEKLQMRLMGIELICKISPRTEEVLAVLNKLLTDPSMKDLQEDLIVAIFYMGEKNDKLPSKILDFLNGDNEEIKQLIYQKFVYVPTEFAFSIILKGLDEKDNQTRKMALESFFINRFMDARDKSSILIERFSQLSLEDKKHILSFFWLSFDRYDVSRDAGIVTLLQKEVLTERDPELKKMMETYLKNMKE